jgi:small-conductance mechanosensitive channel
MGGETLDVGQVNIRVVVRTLPGRQFDVGRVLRERIGLALAEAGVTGGGQAAIVSTDVPRA